jgi:hypothetical protein
MLSRWCLNRKIHTKITIISVLKTLPYQYINSYQLSGFHLHEDETQVLRGGGPAQEDDGAAAHRRQRLQAGGQPRRQHRAREDEEERRQKVQGRQREGS